MNEPPITIWGNATADAELRFLPSGVAVANFTVAQTPRVKQGEGYVDGETMFFRVAVWRDQAEHVAETVKRGMRVVVTGRLKVRQYETDGQNRTSVDVEADEVGVALRYGSASFNKAERQQAGQPQAPDPWSTATPMAQPQPQGWGAAPPAGPPPGWTQPQQPAPQQQGGWGQYPTEPQF